MKKHTTLRELRDADACKERYAWLVSVLDKTTYDDSVFDVDENFVDSDYPEDQPISLAFICENSGVDDAIWALRTCPEISPLIGKVFSDHIAHLKNFYASSISLCSVTAFCSANNATKAAAYSSADIDSAHSARAAERAWQEQAFLYCISE